MNEEKETDSSTQETETTTTTTTTEEKPDKSLVNNEQETKTEETKTEETKTEETKEEKSEVTPLTVEDIKLPEGFEAQPELMTKFVELFNGEMDPKERAQALVNLHTETIRTALEADSEAWDNMQTEWKDAVKADPDIGGAKLQPTLANVNKLVDEYGTQELKDVFDLTGAGNNIHMIKFLNVIAEKLTEGGYKPGATPSNAADSEEAKAQRMFPSMKG